VVLELRANPHRRIPTTPMVKIALACLIGSILLNIGSLAGPCRSWDEEKEFLISTNDMEDARLFSHMDGEKFFPIGAVNPSAEDYRLYVWCGFNSAPLNCNFYSWKKEGELNLAYLHTKLQEAYHHGIRIRCHLHTNGAPGWFVRKHGDIFRMFDQWGYVFRHWSSTCYQYEPYVDMVKRFDSAVVELVQSNPCWDEIVYGWDLRNEPSYPRSVDTAPFSEKVHWFDYNPFAQGAFRAWLRSKYHSIRCLNRCWSTNYRAFYQVKAPKDDTNKAIWVDWLLFREEALAKFLSDVAESVYEKDKRKRPVTTKIMGGCWHLDEASFDDTGFDTQAQLVVKGVLGCDWYTNSIGGAIPLVVKMRNCANMPIWMLEFNTNYSPSLSDAQLLHRLSWSMVAHGLDGLHYFCWGRWKGFEHRGLVSLDGSPTPRLPYIAQFAHGLHRLSPYIVDASVSPPARVAIFDPRIDTLLMFSSERPMNWSPGPNPFFEVHNALRRLGYVADFLTSQYILEGALSRYKVLFMVNAKHVDPDVAREVKKFLNAGGSIFADARTAYYDTHHKVMGLQLGGAMRVYEKSFHADAEDIICMTEHMHPLAQGLYEGGLECHSKEILQLKPGASPIGYFRSGEPAIIAYEMGSSKRLYLATYMGTGLYHTPKPYTILCRNFLNWVGLKPDYRIVPDKHSLFGQVDVSMLVDKKGNQLLIVTREEWVEETPPTGLSLEIPLCDGKPICGVYLLPSTTRCIYSMPYEINNGYLRIKIPYPALSCAILVAKDGYPLLGSKVLNSGRKYCSLHLLSSGEAFWFEGTLYNPSLTSYKRARVTLTIPAGWSADSFQKELGPLPPGGQKRFQFRIRVPTQIEEGLYPLLLKAQCDSIKSTPCTELVWIKHQER